MTPEDSNERWLEPDYVARDRFKDRVWNLVLATIIFASGVMVGVVVGLGL